MGEGEGRVGTKLVQSLWGVRSSTRLWHGRGFVERETASGELLEG